MKRTLSILIVVLLALVVMAISWNALFKGMMTADNWGDRYQAAYNAQVAKWRTSWGETREQAASDARDIAREAMENRRLIEQHPSLLVAPLNGNGQTTPGVTPTPEASLPPETPRTTPSPSPSINTEGQEEWPYYRMLDKNKTYAVNFGNPIDTSSDEAARADTVKRLYEDPAYLTVHRRYMVDKTALEDIPDGFGAEVDRLVNNRAEADRLAADLEGRIDSISVEKKPGGMHKTLVMDMVEGRPIVKSATLPRDDNHQVIRVRMKDGSVYYLTVRCGGQPEERVREEAPASSRQTPRAPSTITPNPVRPASPETPPPATQTPEQPARAVAPQPSASSTTPVTTGEGGATPQPVTTPDDIEECVNGTPRDQDGKCGPIPQESPQPSQPHTPKPSSAPTPTTPGEGGATPQPSDEPSIPQTTRPASKQPSSDPAVQGNAGNGDGHNQDSGPGEVTVVTTQPTSATTRVNPTEPTRASTTTSAPQVTQQVDPVTEATADTDEQTNDGVVSPGGDF